MSQLICPCCEGTNKQTITNFLHPSVKVEIECTHCHGKPLADIARANGVSEQYVYDLFLAIKEIEKDVPKHVVIQDELNDKLSGIQNN